jgi:hypothetical protein
LRNIVAGQEAVTRAEYLELAAGFDPELFAGVPGESAEERAVRLDVAGDVLAELREDDPEAAEMASELLRTAAVPMARLSFLLGNIPSRGKLGLRRPARSTAEFSWSGEEAA